MSRLLVWQVGGHLGLSKTTLGMVRGRSFAVVLTTTSGGGHNYRSQGFDTPEEAEVYLLAETDYAGGDLLLPPTECGIEEPPDEDVDSDDFQEWAVKKVLAAVELETLLRTLREMTLKFGEPQPAFRR